MEKKVGIVMPCINLWEKYTFPALVSVATAQRIAAEKGIASQVILIDNASTDETKDKAMNRAGIDYWRNEEQWGFQRSVNFGIKCMFAKGCDYVFVLNNDIVLHPNAIWRLVERMEKGDVGMVTCLDSTGEAGREPARLIALDDVEKEACPETPNPCFSAFMLDRLCWMTIGEFDEVFFPAYYEDNDYHYRMQIDGLLAITYPPAMFLHWGSATQMEALGGGRRLTDSANQHAQYVKKWGGDPGKEVFKSPYDESDYTIRSTLQNRSVNTI